MNATKRMDFCLLINGQIFRLTVEREESLFGAKHSEANILIRGAVFPATECRVGSNVEQAFELSTVMFTVSDADLCGKKI
jgi:hypothetical protein